MRHVRDEEFTRGQIPMTKYITRTVAMGFMEVKPGDLFLDIGAGTGSISVQAALFGARVIAIEKECEGVRLIGENQRKFGVELEVIHGQAPLNLPERVIDKCFIGGSGGKLGETFEYLDRNLREEGILCATFITLDNFQRFMDLLRLHRYKSIESHLVQAAEIGQKGMLKAQNPIFIAKGVK